MILRVDGQAVNLLLHRHIAQLPKMSGIVFLENRNRTVITGDVDAFQAGIECNNIAAFGLREISDWLMGIEAEDGHEVVVFTRQECQPVFTVESHSVIALAFADWIFSDLFVGCGIDFSNYVLVLKIHVHALRDRIITRVAGFALKVNSCEDLVLGHVYDSLSVTALVGNVDLVKWSGISYAVRL